MLENILEFVQRLDLAHPKHVFGLYFPEIIALLSIVFGGSFLLFARKHYDYFRGIAGFLLGAWIGVFLKDKVLSDGPEGMIIYIVVSAVICTALFIFFKRLVGLALGAFVILLLISVFVPEVIETSNNKYFMLCILALLGGALGALFPTAIFIFISSVIGATFVTYGLTYLLLNNVMISLHPNTQLLLHVAIFLPLVIFGMLYQFMTSREQQSITAPPQQAQAKA